MKHPPTRARRLMEKGFSCLNTSRFEEALKVGRLLKKLRHSSAFEIIALARCRRGQLKKAITTLEEGVSKAGTVWVLWKLLGNCYSDAGRFDDAERAYQQALRQERCDTDVVHLNRGIAFDRRDRPRDCLKALDRVESARLVRRADACRIRAMLALGKRKAARSLAQSLTKRRPTHGKYDDENESEIFTACGLALKDSATTRRTAERLAHRAVELCPTNTTALSIIRELLPMTTRRLKTFRLLVHGEWNEPIGKSRRPHGFFRTFDVAAENEEAALRYTKPFFPTAVRRSLAIEESKLVRLANASLAGVYSVTGYSFYPLGRRR